MLTSDNNRHDMPSRCTPRCFSHPRAHTQTEAVSVFGGASLSPYKLLQLLLFQQATSALLLSHMDTPVHAPVVKVLPGIRQGCKALQQHRRGCSKQAQVCAAQLQLRGGKMRMAIDAPVWAWTDRQPWHLLSEEEPVPTFLVCGRFQNKSLMRPQNTTIDSLQQARPIGASQHHT